MVAIKDRHGIAICGAGHDGGDVLGHAVSFFGCGVTCCLRVHFGGGRRSYLIALASAQSRVDANVAIWIQLGYAPQPQVAQMVPGRTRAFGLMTHQGDERHYRQGNRPEAHASDGRKRRVAVRIERLQVDVLIGQSVQPDGAEKRLVWLHQQDRLGKAAVIEPAAEVHTGFDGKHVEVGQIDAETGEGRRLHDLREIRAYDQDVAVTEPDMEPRVTVHALRRLADTHDLALNAHRQAGRFVDQATYSDIDYITNLGVIGQQAGDHLGVRHGPDQHTR